LVPEGVEWSQSATILVLSAILFGWRGAFIFSANIITIFMSIELMLTP